MSAAQGRRQAFAEAAPGYRVASLPISASRDVGPEGGSALATLRSRAIDSWPRMTWIDSTVCRAVVTNLHLHVGAVGQRLEWDPDHFP